MLNIGLNREKHEKFSLSETARPRALIFGMQHHSVNLYQICSNYVPRAKNSPASGHMLYIGLYREKHEKIFLSETIRPRALIFGMMHYLVVFYQVCSNYSPEAKIGSTSGVNCFT